MKFLFRIKGGLCDFDHDSGSVRLSGGSEAFRMWVGHKGQMLMNKMRFPEF